jgi:DNA-binding MarR family transcriptional regulator
MSGKRTRGKASGADAPALLVRVDRAMEQRWPGSDASATELAINLFALNGRVMAFAEALCAKHGVPSPAAFNVMTILEGSGAPLAPSAIAERMFVTRATMTGVVGSLERRDFVRVRPHPDDGRMSLVALTPRGRTTVRRMRPELHAAEKKWMSCLDADEVERFRVILAKLQRHAPTIG